MLNVNSPKYIEAKQSLPRELQPLFEQLVTEYSFHTMRHYGRGYVAYQVLADLIRDGWTVRESAKREPGLPYDQNIKS